MAQPGLLLVIYNFDEREGDEPELGHVRLQDWHTKLGSDLRKVIWEESHRLFSEHGLVDPELLRLWNGDGQLIDLEKKLGGDIFVVDATMVEVFVTPAQAEKHNQPLSMGRAGTSAASSDDGTAPSDALTVSDSFVTMAASSMSQACYFTLIWAAGVVLSGTDAFKRHFCNLMTHPLHAPSGTKCRNLIN